MKDIDGGEDRDDENDDNDGENHDDDEDSLGDYDDFCPNETRRRSATRYRRPVWILGFGNVAGEIEKTGEWMAPDDVWEDWFARDLAWRLDDEGCRLPNP